MKQQETWFYNSLFLLLLLSFVSGSQENVDLFILAEQSNAQGWMGDVVEFASENASENDTLKILTYNIWNGFDWGKDTLRRSKLQQWMKNLQPSVVALQELCGYSTEKLEENAKSAK